MSQLGGVKMCAQFYKRILFVQNKALGRLKSSILPLFACSFAENRPKPPRKLC